MKLASNSLKLSNSYTIIFHRNPEFGHYCQSVFRHQEIRSCRTVPGDYDKPQHGYKVLSTYIWKHTLLTSLGNHVVSLGNHVVRSERSKFASRFLWANCEQLRLWTDCTMCSLFRFFAIHIIMRKGSFTGGRVKHVSIAAEVWQTFLLQYWLVPPWFLLNLTL